jgi:hypothetical protein
MITSCPQCGQKLRYPDGHASYTLRCARCGNQFAQQAPSKRRGWGKTVLVVVAVVFAFGWWLGYQPEPRNSRNDETVALTNEVVRSNGKLAGYWECNNSDGTLIFQIAAADGDDKIQLRAQRDFKEVSVVSAEASTNGVNWSQIRLVVQIIEKIEVEVEAGWDSSLLRMNMRNEFMDFTNTYDLVLELKTDHLTGSSSGCKYKDTYLKSDGPVSFERISAEIAKPLDPYQYNSDVYWNSR